MCLCLSIRPSLKGGFIATRDRRAGTGRCLHPREPGPSRGPRAKCPSMIAYTLVDESIAGAAVKHGRLLISKQRRRRRRGRAPVNSARTWWLPIPHAAQRKRVEHMMSMQSHSNTLVGVRLDVEFGFGSTGRATGRGLGGGARYGDCLTFLNAAHC